MDLHNQIAQISLDFFKTLPKTGKPTSAEWTVVSCVVRENTESKEFEVVALGTGSKCIGRTQMSRDGDILNDSHAEVVCRRAFLNYLFYEIERSVTNKSDILVFNPIARKFKLQSNVAFHFFTTKMPCGDATIFVKADYDDAGDSLIVNTKQNFDSHKTKRIKLGRNDVFRTGAKCLPDSQVSDSLTEGVNYHTVGLIRTKPGRGDPTLSVSCSDKIAKWCYVGIQGSLLSMLVDAPVYLKSFTVSGGTPYCENVLERAFYKRFNSTSDVHYQQHKMFYGQANIDFEFTKCDEKRPSPCSIIWNKDDVSKSEVAVGGKKQGVTKKKLNTPIGRVRICKVELFKQFCKIANLIKFDEDYDFASVAYNEAKNKSVQYQEAWRILRRDVFKIWTVKNPTLLQFHAK